MAGRFVQAIGFRIAAQYAIVFCCVYKWSGSFRMRRYDIGLNASRVFFWHVFAYH